MVESFADTAGTVRGERRADPGASVYAMSRSFLPDSYHRRKNEKMMLNTTLMMMQVTIGK